MPDGIKAALVTYILKKTCFLLAMSGTEMNKWAWGLFFVREWAKANGCNELRIHGRKGWSKALGFEITGTDNGLYIMRQEL